MRDLLILLVVFASVAATLRYPFVGILAWAWFTLMTPNQLGYGAFGVPLNLVIAAATMGSIVINGGLKNFRADPVTLALVLFAGWLTISQWFSLDADQSAQYYDRFIKTIVFILLAIQMTTTRLRAHALLWMLVISVGYFGAKGGLFTLATLGQYRVQGIEDTVLADNNHLGIAMATMLPLVAYLREQSARAIVRRGLEGLFVLMLIAVIGTQSRGAFISLVVFAAFYWLYSKHKLAIIAAFVAIATPTLFMMPSKWFDRMATIGTATEDESFMGRVNAWRINFRFAQENPVTGAGLRVPYDADMVRTIEPGLAEGAKAAHSIYFEMLGGTGFVGLLIFLTTLAVAILTAMATARRDKGANPDVATWKGRFAYYAQISLITFCVGGASVSLEMWDGYWIVIALIAAAARAPAEGAAESRAKGQQRAPYAGETFRRARLADRKRVLPPVVDA